MRKRFNPVALALCAFAAFYAASDLLAAAQIAGVTSLQGIEGPTGQWVTFWIQARGSLMVSCQLLGIGVLIELVDQVRWNALPDERRVKGPGFREYVGRLRSWGADS